MIYKSRFGFHPCSYETYRKLKRLNFLVYMSRRQDAAWERWHRKKPENRVIKRRLPAAYDEQNKCWIRQAYEIIGPRPEPITCIIGSFLATKIEEDYRRSRQPVGSESVVPKLALNTTCIAEAEAILESWYAQYCLSNAVAK